MSSNGRLITEAMRNSQLAKAQDGLTITKPAPVYDNIITPGKMRQQAIMSQKAKQLAALKASQQNRAEVRSAGPKRSTLSKALAIAANPVTAASYVVKGQDIPENFERGSINAYDVAGSLLNPFSVIDAASKTPESFRQGDYLGAAMNMADIIPGVVTVPKSARAALNQIDRLSPVGRRLDAVKREGRAAGLNDFEIAQRQMNEVGITSNQRQGYVPGVSDLARKYITPYGYTGMGSGSKLKEIVENIKRGGIDYSDEFINSEISPARADAWNMYLGFPQRYNTFRMAETAPVNHRAYNKKQLQNMDLYSLNDEAKIADEVGRSAENTTPFGFKDSMENLKADSFVEVDPVDVMGNYNARFTNDGLQYNDIWDLDPSIAPVNFLPRKVKDMVDQNPLFYKKTYYPGAKDPMYSPRRMNINVSRFLGKPYMSHGNVGLSAKDYTNRMISKLQDDLNIYSNLNTHGVGSYTPKINMLQEQIEAIQNIRKQAGGAIVSPYGQWAYPGQPTIVPTATGSITMQGVPYPVYGQDETGYAQMMYPGGEYEFPGQMVYEVPVMGKGGQHGGLDRWFAEKWVDVKTGKACGRQEGESRRSYPACRPSRRVSEDTPKTASELSASEREKFKRSKTSSERINYQHRRREYGGEQTENDMANKPNNPALWSRAKSLAKQKFDVYPSAYANGWAAKWYKGKGGTWSKAMYGMEMMGDGGAPDNEGFRALPPAVQQKIMDNMAAGGEKMPPEIARARFAAAGNTDKLDDYGYAYGGYMPEMMGYGGAAQQAAIAIAMKKAGKKPKSMADGGEPNGEMALGQMAAVQDKMNKLLQFVRPNDNLDPWIASKLAVMDHSADAISDYLMYGPEAEEQDEMEMMKNGGYTVTRSNDRKGKTHKVTGPDGTVKYFGDSKLGQHPRDPERKKAFYARHKKNLAGNPYFRAFARATWADGGEMIDEMANGGYIGYDGKRHMSSTPTWSGNAGYEMGGMPCYECGGMYEQGGGIYIDPKNKGKFTAAANQRGMGVQEFAAQVLQNPDAYSSTMVKRANFARNAAKWKKQDGGWHSEWDQNDSEYVSADPLEEQFNKDVAANPAGMIAINVPVTPSSRSASSKGTSSKYSIVDYLNAQGLPSDFASRKAMAEKMGIPGYRGTAQQNMELLSMISNASVSIQPERAYNFNDGNMLRSGYNAGSANPFMFGAMPQRTAATPAAKNSAAAKKINAANAKDAEEAMTFAKYKAQDPYFFAEESDPTWVKAIDYPFTMLRDLGSRAYYDKDPIAVAELLALGLGSRGLVGRTKVQPYSGGQKALPSTPTKALPGSRIPSAGRGPVPGPSSGGYMGPRNVSGSPRGFQIPDAGLRSPGYPKFGQGGPMVGDEMEVTPGQLEQLRAQGYQFEII